MINERNIAEKFSIVWKQHFPLLTPNFMRVFNEYQVQKINAVAVPINDNVRYDLISEAAFNLASIVFDGSIKEQVMSDSMEFKKLIEETAKMTWNSSDYYTGTLSINAVEFLEIKEISKNIIEFIKLVKRKTFQFKPRLAGYSFIPDLVGDLSIDDTLFEIKTVNRNFKSNDLKQLFIYLALQQVSNQQKWKYAGLYNPRKGTYCKFNVRALIYEVTGGKSPNEAFDDLLNSLVRDIQIDSKF